MDVIDIASEREDAHRAAVIAAHLAQKKTPVRPSAEHCEDCGEDIPEARRQIIPGVVLCVECQERQERMHR
ncbi:TraR/DksA family transcriptional regulator [Pseudomonas corrugata]|uniref:TraR/DksA family transcriptional regulator n=1 Tax=Pseudomonas corrugata TaxID=47879 RepID=A0A8B6UUP4_9PSED|nr:TraR/DksA family transcriptional regulator [Pseudomonas corrugata]MDU9022153.1 TraR/DksA family transcriptional regulator [Pseudomonas corrugata]QTH15621.1 TraR/DksA family transcriptional regulator [Pseudomonas corrugata]UZD92736.1 TraR/DksA family transcriptional regulator [Pseudomonas corrugata]UZD96778.1 TraR/DksA family transcriptional regulator [Pseudomonas corrugata]